MDVQRIADGLWRWTGFHEEWKQTVGSVYLEGEDAIVLIDPIVPPEDAERFWRALERDVERAGLPVHVLVTVFWHTRDAAAVAERLGARVWAPARGRKAIERRAGREAETYRPQGEPLPGGVVAYPTVRAAEVVFWLPAHRTLVPGDVLLGDGDGGLRLCPRGWLPQGRSQDELRESLRPLLDLPVERVLVSHGEPVLAHAGASLHAILA